MNTDPQDVFVSVNPLGLGEREREKERTGCADVRTHNDHLVFLAGYKAGAVEGEQREYQRHRPMSAEGCKPELSIMLSRMPCVAVAGGRDLSNAEGETPDINIHPSSIPISKALSNRGGISTGKASRPISPAPSITALLWR